MNTNGVFIQSNRLVQNGIKQQFLRDGNSVLVRIISDKGNGQYDAFVGGVKTTVNSKIPLQPGETFVSVLHEKNGMVSLSKLQSDNIQTTSGLQILQNQNVLNLLENLGLPADGLSYNLLQQMKQLEMKFDSGIMNKIRNLSLKFKNKEKSALQLLSILAEKGIDSSVEELLQLIQEYDGDLKDWQNHNQQNNKKYELMNKINEVKGKWYLLPYEILDLENKDEDGNCLVAGCGCIKVFTPVDKVKMINFDCLYQQMKYLFNINFENGICIDININISSLNSTEIFDKERIVELLEKKLKNSGKNVKVNWCEADLISGTASSMEDLYSFEGIV